MNTEQKAQQVEDALVLHGCRGMEHGFETWCGLPWEPEMAKATKPFDMTCRGCTEAFNDMMNKLKK